MALHKRRVILYIECTTQQHSYRNIFCVRKRRLINFNEAPWYNTYSKSIKKSLNNKRLATMSEACNKIRSLQQLPAINLEVQKAPYFSAIYFINFFIGWSLQVFYFRDLDKWHNCCPFLQGYTLKKLEVLKSAYFHPNYFINIIICYFWCHWFSRFLISNIIVVLFLSNFLQQIVTDNNLKKIVNVHFCWKSQMLTFCKNKQD